MENAVVSEYLKELLVDCEVKAAVFTTYSFDPEFFELEVIPLLLPGNIPFSSDSRVKQFQVREALRESSIELEVFYDLPLYRKEGSASPAMQYLFHGIDRGNSAFHAKLAIILVRDQKHSKDCLLVGAGSNNLTRAGWWDNIECVHWETVWPDEAPRRFLNRLRDDVAWLQGERYLEPPHNTSALNKISEYLLFCKSWKQAEPVPYYGIQEIERDNNFPRFLRQQARRLWHYSNWTLEIISPFFAEDPENRNHEVFYDLGVQEIHLLLPTDQEGTALCQQEYFDHINSQENIHWADWAAGTAALLGLKDKQFRRLHAKIYHFYNKKQSWAFIGSVNFSHKAMRENSEAGFFVKLEKAGALLKPIRQTGSVEKFEAPDELPPGFESEELEVEIPRIYLSYDWREKKLRGVSEERKRFAINILNPEGDAAIADWHITGKETDFGGDTTSLERLLRNGSLVKVSGYNVRTDSPISPHQVMILQTGWSHKPLDLPDLAPEQILAIYADMSSDQRQLLLMNAQIRKLVLEGAAGDITAPLDEDEGNLFFSEYAEIFHAFRRLKRRLFEARENDNEAVVNYYLSGVGMDSMPTLIERITSSDSSVNRVTAYLLLLCAQEIYQDTVFIQYPLVEKLLNDVCKAIKDIKSADAIKLENNSPSDRRKFFNWFEGQFFKAYRIRRSD